MITESGVELLELGSLANFPYDYSCGKIGSFFFKALRDEQKIFGRKCGKCGKVYIPPRPVCGPCFAPTTEWVEVGPRARSSVSPWSNFRSLTP